MKLVMKIVTPLVVVLGVATAAVAVADPVTPYPKVAADAACEEETFDVKDQQIKYNGAKKRYDRIAASRELGVGSKEDLAKAEQNLNQVALALSKAKYAEAVCANENGKDLKKACIALSLKLNQLLDELAIRVQLERVAKQAFEDAKKAAVGTAPDVIDDKDEAAQLAVNDREKVEARIKKQRALIDKAKENDCKDYPFERPKPNDPAPMPDEPTSTSPAPPTATSTVEPAITSTAPATLTEEARVSVR